MRVLIVRAHPVPASFNGAMAREATAVLRDAGYEVVESDLHAMGFDPVSGRRNFATVKRRNRLKQQDEEEFAREHDGYIPELQAEMDKLAWCDLLIVQFPLWWLGMPGIPRAGSIAFSRSGAVYSEEGIYGPISSVLFPIHHGILSFAGFTVIEPFIVYAPSRIGVEQRAASRLSRSPAGGGYGADDSRPSRRRL